jgi:hypothetical protein
MNTARLSASGNAGVVAVIVGWLISLADQYLAPRGFAIPPDVQAALIGILAGCAVHYVHMPQGLAGGMGGEVK